MMPTEQAVDRVKAWLEGGPQASFADVGSMYDALTALQARVGELEHGVLGAEPWLTAALDCPTWSWDGDQHDAATEVRDHLRSLLALLTPPAPHSDGAGS